MRVLGFLMVFSVLCAPAALASDEEARKEFLEGKTQYNLGDFDKALAHFSKAYELRPAPLLLFNIGQCHRQLKNHERALFFLDGYLREDPETSDRKLVESLIKEERALLADEEKAEAAAKIAADKARAADEARKKREAELDKRLPDPDPNPDPEGEWVPWAIGGGVAVVVVAGVATAAAIAMQGPPPGQVEKPTLGEIRQ